LINQLIDGVSHLDSERNIFLFEYKKRQLFLSLGIFFVFLAVFFHAFLYNGHNSVVALKVPLNPDDSQLWFLRLFFQLKRGRGIGSTGNNYRFSWSSKGDGGVGCAL